MSRQHYPQHHRAALICYPSILLYKSLSPVTFKYSFQCIEHKSYSITFKYSFQRLEHKSC